MLSSLQKEVLAGTTAEKTVCAAVGTGSAATGRKKNDGKIYSNENTGRTKEKAAGLEKQCMPAHQRLHRCTFAQNHHPCTGKRPPAAARGTGGEIAARV